MVTCRKSRIFRDQLKPISSFIDTGDFSSNIIKIQECYPPTLANWLLNATALHPWRFNWTLLYLLYINGVLPSHSCKLTSERYRFSPLVVQLDPFISLFFIFTFSSHYLLIFRFNYMCFQVFLLLPSSLSFLGLFLLIFLL